MTIHRARRIALVLGCMVLPHAARAQVPVTPGDRVRIVDASNNPLTTGELVRLSRDSVSISTTAARPGAPTTRTWSLGGQRRLEVRSLHGHALIGAFAGQVVGMLAVYAVAPKDNKAIGVGMLAGTVIGGFVGHRIKSETWRRVDYCIECVTIAPSPNGVLLGVSLTF